MSQPLNTQRYLLCVFSYREQVHVAEAFSEDKDPPERGKNHT